MSSVVMAYGDVARPAMPSAGAPRRMAAAGALLVLVFGLLSGRLVPGVAGVASNSVLHHGAPHAAVGPQTQTQPPRPAPSVHDIADRMLTGDTPGSLEAVDPSYRATFDGRGIHYVAAHATKPLSISVAALARGGNAVALRPSAWTGAGSVAERTVAPNVLERVTAAPGHIEWDVVLAAPPRGRGDLAVTANLAGAIGARTIAADGGRPAVQFTADHGAPVTLGELVVRDATGAPLFRALPTVHAGTLTLRVPARVLDGARYPLTVDPVINTTVTAAPAGTHYNSSIAFNGSQWLIVWNEFIAGNYDIYGSVINADTSAAPTGAFQISFRAQDEVLPDVAWTGSRWLVVWEDHFSSSDFDIRGQLLDDNHQLVGIEIPIAVPTSVQMTPAVAAGSGQFLVTWSDNRNGPSQIYARRVDTNGANVGDAFRIDDSPSSGYTDTIPDVAWNGSVFLIVWEDKFGPLQNGSFVYQVMARVVSPDTSLGFTNALALFSQGIVHDPAVASDGSKFLAVWEQGSDVIGARVDPNSILYTGEQIPVSTANDTQDDPVVTFNGGVYFVAWRDRRTFPSFPDYDIYAARVGTDGTVKDPNGIAIASSGSDEQVPAVAPASQGKWGVSYQVGPFGGSDTINARLVAPK